MMTKVSLSAPISLFLWFSGMSVGWVLAMGSLPAEDHLFIEKDGVKIGIDREKGGAITWLSWAQHTSNGVNVHDPGRLIQQSYYAGLSIDRKSDGQSRAWSPWTWNPIQGGGVGSWARVTEFRIESNQTLFSETVPKLWDMPNEEAQAKMLQWTEFEPDCIGVIRVTCEFRSQRDANDRWGKAIPRHQEIPACYFTRTFSTTKSYLGNGSWEEVVQPAGPPWGKTNPPRKSMACLEKGGQGIALFSPASTLHWNFGPHGKGESDDSRAGPCMHVAPLDRIPLAHRSTYRYRYWLCVGSELQLAKQLDLLWEKYAEEKGVHQVPAESNQSPKE